MAKCPHDEARFCPLYHAAHEGGGHGCDDGRLGEGGCAVDRGLDYDRAYVRLCLAKPQLVAECEFKELEEARKQQRARNLRAVGLH